MEELGSGTATAAFAVAMALLVAGSIALAAVIAADADARSREGLAYALVGASRARIAAARLGEVAAIGVLAAALGGAAGLYGGDWLAERALRVDGVVTVQSALLPLALGLVAAVAAGLAAGIISMPRRRGQSDRPSGELTGHENAAPSCGGYGGGAFVWCFRWAIIFRIRVRNCRCSSSDKQPSASAFSARAASRAGSRRPRARSVSQIRWARPSKGFLLAGNQSVALHPRKGVGHRCLLDIEPQNQILLGQSIRLPTVRAGQEMYRSSGLVALCAR